MNDIKYCRTASPIGELIIATSPAGVCRIGWQEDKYFHNIPADWHHATTLHYDVVAQLNEYFAGQRQQFDLPIAQTGTAFQHQAWQALTTIPYGTTSTYGQQAAAMDNPKAVRAVGAANGRNQVPIIVPCHRVIGANGSLTGFAGGIEVKRWLLEHEGSLPSA